MGASYVNPGLKRRNDDAAVTPVTAADTVAYSIANPDPPSGARALSAARATDAAVVSVDEAAIVEAQSRMARQAGLSVEVASADPLAGIRRLADQDRLDADDDVVLIATGTGFKAEPDGPVEAPIVDRDRLADRRPALL